MSHDFDDPEMFSAAARRLLQLDDMHRRAQSPSARMHIEQKMREIRQQLEDIRAKAAAVDIAFEQWKRSVDYELEKAEKS